MLAKLGAEEIPATTLQFIFPFGCLPVALALLGARRFKLERSLKGIFFSVLMGVLSGIGGLALFAAYRTRGNTAVITAVTAMYPMVTVLLAITVLRERLTARQVAGLAFAAAAFIIFSV